MRSKMETPSIISKIPEGSPIRAWASALAAGAAVEGGHAEPVEQILRFGWGHLPDIYSDGDAVVRVAVWPGLWEDPRHHMDWRYYHDGRISGQAQRFWRKPEAPVLLAVASWQRGGACRRVQYRLVVPEGLPYGGRNGARLLRRQVRRALTALGLGRERVNDLMLHHGAKASAAFAQERE